MKASRRTVRPNYFVTNSDLAFWSCVVGCFLLLAYSVTSASLWTDEAFIAWVLGHGSLSGVVTVLSGAGIPSPADRQYPLYDLWEWLWIRAFGDSEYALRAANLPFGALYVVALALTSRYAFRRVFSWIPLVFAPFVWFYMNEARPYLMLTALATFAVGTVLVYLFGSEASAARALPLMFPAFLLTLSTHILAIMLLPGLVFLLLVAPSEKRSSQLRGLRKSLPCLLFPACVIALFYCGTLVGSSTHNEIANNQNRGPSPIMSAVEIAYEQFGFLGLGPSRNVLRAEMHESVVIPYIPWLIFGLAGIGIACFIGGRRPIDRTTLVLVVGWIISLILAVAVAEAIHVRFLGRHMAATIPLLLFAGLSYVRTRLGLLALASVFIVSDVRLATLETYMKDDNRSAVAEVILLSRDHPGSIDWEADDLAANYYGLSFAAGRNTGASAVAWPIRVRASNVTDLRVGEAEALVAKQLHAGPVYLAFSKPDIFDVYGGWTTTIRARAATLVARYPTFEVYEFHAPALPFGKIKTQARSKRGGTNVSTRAR